MNKIAILLLLSMNAGATWKGKLDLNWTATSPLVEREAHDGQWLAGAQLTPWLLQKDGVTKLGVGFYTAWNAQHGNSSYGPALYVPLSNLNFLAAWVSDTLGLGGKSVPKWLSFLGQATALEGMVGYRPTHDQSVNGDLTYGAGAVFKVGFDADGLIKAGI